ncbi:hypothetical protein A3Q56_06611 [Intoshia linei]|uniref:Uncharacterized protein n=1 Tax=Intoshia linei TaxID=1819745 RepID=A0A177AUL3_9BILA|nr:hypothetical protein A3Q56_06611 [Intoshia linei]
MGAAQFFKLKSKKFFDIDKNVSMLFFKVNHFIIKQNIVKDIIRAALEKRKNYYDYGSRGKTTLDGIKEENDSYHIKNSRNFKDTSDKINKIDRLTLIEDISNNNKEN